MKYWFIQVDLKNKEHCAHLLKLLNDYMEDPMGGGVMTNELGKKIIEGLKGHKEYLGFFVMVDSVYVGLANCNVNFSTFKAKHLINIHDFIVAPEYRRKGVGRFLLTSILTYAKENGYCRVNLEVREDNLKAQSLYKDLGFQDCHPKMFFWENNLNK